MFTLRRIDPFEQLSINYLWFEDCDDTNETTCYVKQEASRLLREQEGDRWEHAELDGYPDHQGRPSIDHPELHMESRLRCLRQAAQLIGIECYCGSDFSLNASGVCCGVIGEVEPPVEPPVEPAIEPAIEPPTEPTIEPAIEPPVEPAIEPTK